jgi:hypothetical protein
MSKTNFMHIRGRYDRDLTVAYRLANNSIQVEFAFAICSPKDQFNKKIGRTIAEGRLNSQRWTVFSDIETETPGIIANQDMHHSILGNLDAYFNS